jgi:5-methylthioadenosine/S-adenosylhomocysteine deaminase
MQADSPDLLIRGAVVITMNPQREILRDAAVAISGQHISHIENYDQLRRRYPDIRVVGDATSVVTPGYINAHQHLTGDRLVRSAIPDTISSNEAIFGWVVPIHEQLTAHDDKLSATASLVEAVSNGVTCTVEAGTVAHPHAVLSAFEQVGARGTIARWGWDIGDGPQVGTADEVLFGQRELVHAVNANPTNKLVHAWVSLVGHDLMSDELVVGASQLARDLRTQLTFHMSPHGGDVDAYIKRTGKRPLVHLHDLGVLGDHVLVAHVVHIDDRECDIIVDTRTAVVSCPWAYLRLAQGITGFGRHATLMRKRARLALGCDSENAGDAVDMIRAAALFIGLARDGEMDPTVASAYDALELITIRGAEAIGLDHMVGSLEIGKHADIVVHRTDSPQWSPPSPDPVLQLIWASDGRSVSDVIVDGRQIVQNGVCITVDEAALRAELIDRGKYLLSSRGRG